MFAKKGEEKTNREEQECNNQWTNLNISSKSFQSLSFVLDKCFNRGPFHNQLQYNHLHELKINTFQLHSCCIQCMMMILWKPENAHTHLTQITVSIRYKNSVFLSIAIIFFLCFIGFKRIRQMQIKSGVSSWRLISCSLVIYTFKFIVISTWSFILWHKFRRSIPFPKLRTTWQQEKHITNETKGFSFHQYPKSNFHETENTFDIVEDLIHKTDFLLSQTTNKTAFSRCNHNWGFSFWDLIRRRKE